MGGSTEAVLQVSLATSPGKTKLSDLHDLILTNFSSTCAERVFTKVALVISVCFKMNSKSIPIMLLNLWTYIENVSMLYLQWFSLYGLYTIKLYHPNTLGV